VNKFGTDNRPDARKQRDHEELPPNATMAIVTLNFAIQGDSTKLPEINTRDDLRLALSRISSDAQVDDCLLTAEVLWSPEDPSEILSRETTYADFPKLVPI